MCSSLTDQVRSIANVTTAVARGDLTQKIDIEVEGEMLTLKRTVNSMVDQLSAFASAAHASGHASGTIAALLFFAAACTRAMSAWTLCSARVAAGAVVEVQLSQDAGGGEKSPDWWNVR